MVLSWGEVTSKIVQVLLQTYIEYLRGLVEERTTINHHGKDLEVDLDSDKDSPISSSKEKSQIFVLPWVAIDPVQATYIQMFKAGLASIWTGWFLWTKKLSVKHWRITIRSSSSSLPETSIAQIWPKNLIHRAENDAGQKIRKRLENARAIAHKVRCHLFDG